MPSATASSNHEKRRRTLDEELRRAGDKLWDADADEDDSAELESGLLVGVGSKSTRKGFLSGGGAAGIPVFMGPGYVEGVEGAEEDEARTGRRSRDSSRSRR